MRIQKLLIIFFVAGSGLSQAFSQTASPQRGSIQLAQNSAAQTAKTRELEDILRTEQEALRKAEAEAAARKKGAATAPVKSTSEEFFRAKKIEPIKATPAQATPQPAKKTVAVAPVSASDDSLVEVLRKKQDELDRLEAEGKLSTPARVQSSPAQVPRRDPVKDLRPTPAPPVVAKPAPVAPVAPIAPAPGRVVAQPKKVISQPAVDAAAEAKLVEAMRKKQAELDAKEGIVRPVEIKKPAVAATPATQDRENAEERIKRIEAEIKAKEAAAKRTADAKPASKKETAKAAKNDAKVQANVASSAPAVDPGSKQARLAELLRKYKADEITPHDYHLQRAKIVAEQ